MAEDIKKSAIKGLAWNMAEKVLTQGFSFVIGIILARIIVPEAYGYIVIATTFISMLEALVEGGLTNALIQKKDADDDHASTMLYFMLLFSAILYGVLFMAAPIIAHYYDYSELTLVTRVFGLSLPIKACRSVYMAIMQKQLKFRLQFFSSLSGTIFAGFIGICLAVTGYGIWALVAYFLTDSFVDTVVMGILLRWKPKKVFSREKLKQLYSYGIYALGWQLVNQYTNQIIDLVIGKKYTSAELSYYNRGKQYPFLLCNIINNVFGSTLFPVFSKFSDDLEKLKDATRRMLKVTTFIQFPILFGFAVVAKPLVLLLLTDKWIECVPFLQITCITYSFWPYLTSFRNGIQAKGDVKITFQNEIFITIARVILCGGALFISPIAVALAFVLVWILDAITNGICVRKVLGYRFLEQLRDVVPNYVCSAMMVICVYLVGRLVDILILKLMVQVLVGVISYVAVSAIIKNDSMAYILQMIKNKKE